MTKQVETKKGFTIIEVVLVLAIAGLIFLMVFIALPALQRSQRDTQRNNDISRMMTAITQYQSNNRGKIPTDWSSFKTNYLTVNNADTFEDPDGTAYTIKWKNNFSATNQAAPDKFNHEIWIYGAAKCNGEALAAGSGNNQIAVLYKREGGGVICRNN
jgi:prepilin-type N-terminal cleavage/methylation domain-containing protein